MFANNYKILLFTSIRYFKIHAIICYAWVILMLITFSLPYVFSQLQLSNKNDMAIITMVYSYHCKFNKSE